MLKALGKNLIVKPVYEVKNNVILTSVKEQPIYWEVISVGIEVDEIIIGDHLLINPYRSEQIKHDDEMYSIVNCNEIQAKIV